MMEMARSGPNLDSRDEHQQTVYGLMAMLTLGPKNFASEIVSRNSSLSRHRVHEAP